MSLTSQQSNTTIAFWEVFFHVSIHTVYPFLTMDRLKWFHTSSPKNSNWLLIKGHYNAMREKEGGWSLEPVCLHVFLAKLRKLISEKNHDGSEKTQITLYVAKF